MVWACGHRPQVMDEYGCIHKLSQTGAGQIWPIDPSLWTLDLDFNQWVTIPYKDADFN